MRIDGCRSCGAHSLVPIVDLGSLPLANALPTTPTSEADAPRFPLELVLCESCALVQITETVPPETLFSDYLYFSSYSETMLAHARALAARLVAERQLGADALVVELASNDGYLLRPYRDAGVGVLGIEPAANVARVAVEQHGIPTRVEFFGEAVGARLAGEGVRADVIHAHNVLAHVADLNGFVAGMAHLLHKEGVAVIEVPHVLEMIERCEFDTIYHEHLCYFSLTSLQRLFARHRLVVTNVERVPIHGGSLRLFVAHVATDKVPSAATVELLSVEADWGVERIEPYHRFGDRVATVRAELTRLLTSLRSEGKRVVAYGASAKGTVLLNYFGLRAPLLEFVVDRSPHKQGRYVPGVLLPILPTERLLETMPDYVLLLVWNLTDEVLAQEAAYRARGGRFIVPIPEVRVL